MVSLTDSSTQPTPCLTIDQLSHEGRGVGVQQGKKVFVDNALPGEEVRIRYTKRHRQYDEAQALEILTPAPHRTPPHCEHFSICGGCRLQHLDSAAQLRYKEQILREQLTHFAGLHAEQWLAPLSGPVWGYRRRARLGVKYVAKKQRVLVGFREKNGRYLAQLNHCATLETAIARLITPLQTLIASLSAYQQIPQIEAALGDDTLALVFRHLVALSKTDQLKLQQFAEEHGVQLYLQPGNEQTTHCVWPEQNPKPLTYRLNGLGTHAQDLVLTFEPQDFIQINATMNQKMIEQAIALLDLTPQDQVLDLFCGLGNFSLPMAVRAQTVVGVEGCANLVARAQHNARANHLSNVTFYTADLFQPTGESAWWSTPFNKLLLDPPRSGACEIIQQLKTQPTLERIVYVSCNSASLARDAGLLAEQGYHLRQAGIMDMFPHTPHSEAICLFTR
jgi:23S rRNA (uracil1939-C5)-methyltransferase